MGEIYHYILLHRISHNTTLYNSLPPGVSCATVHLYSFEKDNCVAVDTLTLIHWFPTTDSDCPPVSSNVSSERTHHACSEFFFNKEPVIQNLFTCQYFVDFEGPETPGDLLLNLLEHFL
jgi:hypothetical protein